MTESDVRLSRTIWVVNTRRRSVFVVSRDKEQDRRVLFELENSKKPYSVMSPSVFLYYRGVDEMRLRDYPKPIPALEWLKEVQNGR